MSVSPTDNISLLSALLQQGTGKAPAANAPVRGDTRFAERLDRQMETGGAAEIPANARPDVIAEVLSLQMLQTSLSLGEGSTEQGSARLFGNHTAGIQALTRAYAATLPGQDTVASAPPPTTSQLHEIDPPPVAVPAPSVHTTGGSRAYDDIIAHASNRYGVDAGLIRAVIKAESGFNPNAVSSAGAQGLMQLMPATARSLGVSDSFDPEQNIMAGTRFLRDMLKRYNGDVDSALAAYNWGPGNVDKGTGRLPRETRDYLARVKQFYAATTA